MRHPQLHAALRAAGLHAARELALRVGDGDEVPFELLSHARRAKASRVHPDGPVLYSYRPLVGLYVERHADALSALPAVAEAQHTMVAAWGVEAYLLARGVERPPADPHERAGLAVRQFLERLFEDSPDFTLVDEHFERAFAELESVLTADATETVVVIPLVGVDPAMATVAITRGVALQRPEALRGEVPDAALVGPDGGVADAVATLRWSARPGSPDTPRRAREATRRLVTALRLHVEGATPSAGPLVWLRPAAAGWRAMAVGGTFASRGVAPLTAEEVPDLRTFVDLVARRLPKTGEVAWALRRWTLALDRDRPEETLTDLLVAARALLEPEGPRSGRLAGRLAALCAEGDERTALSRRFARLALEEQEIMAGSRRVDADLPELVDELADCLRAVLRDCVVGHLRGDLVEIAEEILDGVADAPRSAPLGWPSERRAGERPTARGLLGWVRDAAAEHREASHDDRHRIDVGDRIEDGDVADRTDGRDRTDADDRTDDRDGSGDDRDLRAAPATVAPDSHAEPPVAADDAVVAGADPDAIHAAATGDRTHDATDDGRDVAEPTADGRIRVARSPFEPRTTGDADDLDSTVPEYRFTVPPVRPLDPTGEIRASRREPRREELWLDVTWDEPQLHEPTEDDDSTGPWPISEAS